jgi:hypothetical protein
MSEFKRARRGRARAIFAMTEAGLLRSLLRQIVELLRDESPARSESEDPLVALLDFSGPVDAPEDPVLARLLPDAYRDDEEHAGEFRRFTERGLRDGKVSQALTMIESLERGGLGSGDEWEDVDADVEVDLDADEVQAWLRGLTDLRLALAERLGVTQDDHDVWEAMSYDDPRVAMHDIYEWLGYLQESLVHTLR